MPPILALLHKLINLCRRCSQRVLPLLLKLFSFLTGRLGPRRSNAGEKLPENEPAKPTNPTSGTIDGRLEAHSRQGALSSTTPGQEVILACSSVPLPSTPPHARTRSRPRSMDSFASFTSRSPTATLFSVASNKSENGLDGEDPYPMSPLWPIRESMNMILDGALSAEPARIGAPPTFDRKRQPREPSSRPRYDRHIKIENISGQWKFAPLESYDVYKGQDVASWNYYVHPEGQVYYRRMGCAALGFWYHTEARLEEEEVLAEVEAFMADIENHALGFHWQGSKPRNVEVVLEIANAEWTYYMVDLDLRCIFWLDEYDANGLVGQHYGIETKTYLRQMFEFEFWLHIEQFPSHRKMYEDTFSELLSIIAHWRIDGITSADSTAPYEDSDFSAVLTTVKVLQDVVKSGHDHSYAVAGTARLMGVMASERYHNFYGFHGARLSIWQSVRGESMKKQSSLIKCMSRLLFNSPKTHLDGLERLYIDGVIRDRRWKKFQFKLQQDWEQFVLYSTVLLNANVAFLSIPSVLSDNNGPLFASPAAVASQVSIVASIASIIVGLLLIRQIRINSKDVEVTADDTMAYLERRKHPQLGLETMAIQYSLPYAFLMWSMVFFLAAIAIASFYSIDGTPNNLSRAIYAAAWLFAIPMILWTVLTGWEKSSNAHWKELLKLEWWHNLIEIQWKKSSKKPWTWPRKAKGDIEADDLTRSDNGTVAEHDAVTPTDPSPAKQSKNNRPWRTRVRNFGPVRRLTFNSLSRE